MKAMYDVDKTAQQLREYKRMREELDMLIEQLQDDVTQYMTENALSEISGNESRITWKACHTQQLDTRALRRDDPDRPRRVPRPRKEMDDRLHARPSYPFAPFYVLRNFSAKFLRST